MREFRDKVAVVTGAASGIGKALAFRFAQEGMRVVLADLRVSALEATASELQASGAHVLAVPTDVSKAQDINSLAEATVSAFGGVHLLCNNAGVGIMTQILESTAAVWEWALGVNLWGVVDGVRVFAPIMRAQGVPCHIVNTASIAGVISPPGLGVYRTTKFAVVGFTEALYHELAEHSPQIGVSLLLPGVVRTDILSSASRSGEEPGDVALPQRLQQALETAMPPESVAYLVLEAVREERFYILTHPERNWQIRERTEDILLGRNPTGRLDRSLDQINEKN